MQLQIYSSLSRKLESFVPLDPDRVTVYVCGPTVYNFAHIGNARPAVVFGLLVRLLRQRFGKVVYARNITDVDDRINQASIETGTPIEAITQRFTEAYRADMQALGVDIPDVEPKATAHIGEIIAMCERLIASGHAYEAEGHVLFSIASYPEYGHLSGRTMDEMIAGARVDVAPYKRDPGDFVLWKPSSDELPGWPSPWGRGRPGWHIECSAMAESHLGETIDIHAGGTDLLFPHHENEIAQSTCAHGGKLFARYWMHNGFVTVDGRKMSKSLGNVLLIHDLRETVPPEALRYLLLNAHYRQPLDWSDSAVHQAIRTLDRMYATLRSASNVQAEPDAAVPEAFEAALCEDLNTPKALALLSQLSRDLANAGDDDSRQRAKSGLLAAGRLIGLLQQDPDAWFQQPGAGGDKVDTARIEALLGERQEARARRDFARADAIRAELSAMGIAIEDSAEGARWRVAAQ